MGNSSTPISKHKGNAGGNIVNSQGYSQQLPLRLQRLHSDCHSGMLARMDVDIRRTLSLLVDQRTLEVKQMWFIMNIAGEAEQALSLKQCLDKLNQAELVCLYRIRGLEWLEDLMNDSTLCPSSGSFPASPSRIRRKDLTIKKTSVGSEKMSTESSPSSSSKSTPTSPTGKSFSTLSI